MNEEQGYDHTEEGRETIALLKKHAPPMPDRQAGAQAVLDRIAVDEPAPAGTLHHLRWIGPLVGAAAAAVVIAFVLSSPPATPQTGNAPAVIADEEAAEETPTPLMIRHEHEYPDIVARVRAPAKGAFIIDAGLKDGLRPGDEMIGSGETRVKVDAAGIFVARVKVIEGELSRHDELRARPVTAPQERAARFDESGGDPGAFFQFGAVFSALPTSEARMMGISDGQAVRVDEVIPALLSDPDDSPSPTLAARLGLQREDVIVEVNGINVRNLGDFASALGWSLAPNLLTVSVLRDGKQLDLRLK